MTQTIIRNSLIGMFNDPTKDHELDELSKGQRSIYCKIAELRTSQLFSDADYSRQTHIYLEHSIKPFTKDLQKELADYQDVFDWDERIFIHSSWVGQQNFDCEVEEGYMHAHEILKNPRDYENFLGAEPSSSGSNHLELQLLTPSVEIDNLRLKEAK